MKTNHNYNSEVKSKIHKFKMNIISILMIGRAMDSLKYDTEIQFKF
jgi:hypothetical protein